ncbi:hypothetical protein DPMN_041889 [Dreissena polymorpha]|uniref:Uncharacterized protein n=1 Tax=Dreissena polymorpha TaxID=45954 RepID=A0A9D4HUA2_DREPO|nr:hypothetical protein DPMN_041889 [Dreissena polymorpha]
MEDYIKAIDTLETAPEEESIILEEEEEGSFQDTDQIDDLTISTVGLKESSDVVLDISSLPLTTSTRTSSPFQFYQTSIYSNSSGVLHIRGIQGDVN